MKSIVLLGKGPSVSQCTKEIVEKYDDIAIVNFPMLNDFFKSLISDKKIKYHFANCGTFDDRYTDEVNDTFNIENILNTNKPTSNLYINYLKNDILFFYLKLMI
jgi:hypothetical protein